MSGSSPGRSINHTTTLRRPGVVPYITAWSEEQSASPLLVPAHGGRGVGYLDEHLYDRDQEGVLWRRIPSKQGRGRPDFVRVHALRQRRVMRRLLCQVCGRPADRNEQGVLWLMSDYRDDWEDWPEGMVTPHPPVCLPCAAISTQSCPHLRKQFAAVRVKEPEITGVYGARYDPRNFVLGPVDDATMNYGDPGIYWVIASQLVMGLYGCTLVDLDAELAAYAQR
ncbi:hypothetical protein [Streptomyces sp. NPDC048669]|uniref:hypothetical protein n=1 Tax=Streptomyces sp. NPDC048669 TaxID=3155267 RepID=UPI003422A1AD